MHETQSSNGIDAVPYPIVSTRDRRPAPWGLVPNMRTAPASGLSGRRCCSVMPAWSRFSAGRRPGGLADGEVLPAGRLEDLDLVGVDPDLHRLPLRGPGRRR